MHEPASSTTIGDYLIQRLVAHGLGHVFGIPGDYVLAFYSQMCRSPLRVIGCTREDNAGFAADAYARIHGLGAVCVTYGVGGLSLCNSVAGAYAEKSPVVVISGAPGLAERVNNPLLHHRVRDFRTQLEVFDKICVAVTDLCEPQNAFLEIDRVLAACVRWKRPVYIELPRDLVKYVPQDPRRFSPAPLVSDPDALSEAVHEAAAWINSCQRPVIIAGVELHRFGLQDPLLELAEGAALPLVTTILGKSVISETHPLYAGLYEGAMGRAEVTQFVEESDCVVMLGEAMTDINMGIYTARLDPGHCIFATSEQLRIRHHHFHDVLWGDFLRGLAAAPLSPPRRSPPPLRHWGGEPWRAVPGAAISIVRLVARLNELIDEQTIVVADIGDALFAASELVTRARTEFLSPAYYTSMGFAVPAALGTGMARPELRTVAIVGDGAFQMTGMEMSNLVRHGCDTVVIVLDNKGYGTERFLHAGAFNDIHPWNYHRLPALFGGGQGYEVRTEEEFEQALVAAWNDRGGVSLLQVHLAEDDVSPSLRRLAERLSLRV